MTKIKLIMIAIIKASSVGAIMLVGTMVILLGECQYVVSFTQ